MPIKITMEFDTPEALIAFLQPRAEVSTVEMVKHHTPTTAAHPAAADQAYPYLEMVKYRDPKPDAAPPPSSSPAPDAGVPPPAAATTITYPDLQKQVTKLASIDKAAAVAICESLGAANFKLLKPEQWQAAYDLTVAALAAKA